MSIQLVTYANQTVTPTNDAIIYEKAVDQNGIFYGCNVTVTSNNVNITGGYGLVCGREFVIQSESIAVTLAPSGTLDGRLYVRLDLADADAPIQLLTATGNTLPALVQDDDVNYTNGTYEMELATFTVGVSSLSDVVETFEEIKGTKEGYMNLDVTASTGTTDGDLYAAITALGWASDVIESELLNTKKSMTKILTGLVPMDAFVITNESINWGGNNYVSVPSSAIPSGSYVLVCAYNGGFQNTPRWITSHAYQGGTWVLHSDTAVSGSMATTLVWIKTTYFLNQ